MVDDIHTILSKLDKPGTRLISDSFARQEMPLKPEIFHGRDELVEGIVQLRVQEETSRVCILGPGGMGKTSVLLAVVELALIFLSHHKLEHHVIHCYIPCKSNHLHSFSCLFIILYRNFTCS